VPSMWMWSSTLGRARMKGDISRPFMIDSEMSRE
jgi:hypothetical protein